MVRSTASTRHRSLVAARATGACALGVVAQTAVDMPNGYFGVADRMTPGGALYAGCLVAMTALLLAVLARRRSVPPWIAWIPPVIPAATIGLFLPALVSDPLLSGLVVVWNVALLAQHLFPPPAVAGWIGRIRTAAPGAESEAELWLERFGPALRHLAGVSLVLTVAVVGYRLSGSLVAQGVCVVLGYGTLGGAWPFLWKLARRGSRAVLVLLAPAAAGLVAAVWLGLGPGRAPWLVPSLLAVSLVALSGVLLAQHQTTVEIFRDFFDHPSRLIVATFAGAVLAGTVLLTFPAASAGTEPVGPLDALFTATSATCVTGLIVLDTPHDFSLFGQLVILGLIQIGGLGIMTLSTFATLLLGGTLGLRGERALTEMLDLQTAPTVYRLIRFIVLSTLAVEAVGALGLAGAYAAAGLEWPAALWRGLFHAVSAFCNAGFALQTDSIVLFREAPVPVLLHAVLITLGGLGFVVLAGVWNRLVRRTRQPLSVQVRVVLVASGALLAAGTALFAACEWNGALAGMSVGDRLVNALFQSATLRTAGFNSVDFAGLGAATVLFMMAFMFIGASPGSTGGGIKTTTATVLLAAIRAMTRRGEPTTLFEREVPREIVDRSLAIVVISAAVIGGGLFLLLLFEDQPFLHLLFETVSAFATVGLSLGATAGLGPAGKLTIIALMFVGRIGPLTLALLLGTGAARRVRFRYPATRLMVG